MKIDNLTTLLALWEIAEMGAPKSARPRDLSTGEELFGRSYAEQARDYLSAQPDYWPLRPALWERHILRIGCSAAEAASLDPWEARIARDLIEQPLVLFAPETATERMERMKSEAAVALLLASTKLEPIRPKRSEPASLRDRGSKRGRAA